MKSLLSFRTCLSLGIKEYILYFCFYFNFSFHPFIYPFQNQFPGNEVGGAGGTLSCTKCEDYCTETEKTLALHVALVHDAIQPYLDDPTLVQAKRGQSSTTPQQNQQLPPLKISHARPSAAPTLFSSEVLNQVFTEPNCPVCLLPFATVIIGKGLATGGGSSHDHLVWHFRSHH